MALPAESCGPRLPGIRPTYGWNIRAPLDCRTAQARCTSPSFIETAGFLIGEAGASLGRISCDGLFKAFLLHKTDIELRKPVEHNQQFTLAG